MLTPFNGCRLTVGKRCRFGFLPLKRLLETKAVNQRTLLVRQQLSLPSASRLTLISSTDRFSLFAAVLLISKLSGLCRVQRAMLSVCVRSALNTYRGLWLPAQVAVRAMSSSGGPTSPYTSLAISRPAESITHVELHRPKKLNAMNKAFWREMVECFTEIAEDPDCRVVLVSGSGKMFTAGMDLMDFAEDMIQPGDDNDTGRTSWNIRNMLHKCQETFSVIEKCPKPVLVAVHGACIGGGVDLITACDIRLCTQDAWFQVKEVDIGMAADVGTLQRLPKVIGSRSLVNELALTARKMYADEAKSSGLVSRVFADKETMMAGALELAGDIAARSPLAVQGTKINLVYSRDHSVAEGLEYMATWNMSMLQSQDVMKSAQAVMEKKSLKEVVFSKL